MTDDNGGNAGGDSGADDRQKSLDDAINRANRAEKNRREAAEASLSKLQAEVEEMKKASLSEQERREKDSAARIRKEVEAEWAPKVKQERVSRLVERALLTKGADPDSVVFIQNMSEIETDEDADAEVQKLLERKPHLVLNAAEKNAPPVPQGGAPRRSLSSPGPGGPDPIYTESQVRAWTNDPEMYAKKKQEIYSALKSGRVVPG